MAKYRLVLICGTLLVGSCSRTPTTTNIIDMNVLAEDGNSTGEFLPPPDNINTAGPGHSYTEREGDLYSYVSAVSDDDKKKGRVVGDVVQYRYRGIVDGATTLELVDDSGEPLERLQCSVPCRIIKISDGSRIRRLPFDPQTVAGSAISDAINGQLEVAKPPRQPVEEKASLLPSRFVGKWNANVFTCFGDDDDDTVTITPGALMFHRLNATIDNVVLSGRTATVSAIVVTEAENSSPKATYRLTLNKTGDQLAIDGVTHSRCPPGHPQ